MAYKSDCEVDGAGRVVLTPEMRDYAKLDRKVQMITRAIASNCGANAAGRTSSSWHNARCVKTRPPSWPACPYEWRPMQPGTHISVLLRGPATRCCPSAVARWWTVPLVAVATAVSCCAGCRQTRDSLPLTVTRRPLLKRPASAIRASLCRCPLR